jgi:hypothetical protein
VCEKMVRMRGEVVSARRGGECARVVGVYEKMLGMRGEGGVRGENVRGEVASVECTWRDGGCAERWLCREVVCRRDGECAESYTNLFNSAFFVWLISSEGFFLLPNNRSIGYFNNLGFATSV